MNQFKLGFWNWCKENHPNIVLEYRDDMRRGLEELEKFVEQYETQEDEEFSRSD